MKPLFIVVEGVDGSGKTTLVRKLTTVLSQGGVKVASFKEPGNDNAIGRAFRKMSEREKDFPPLAAVFLLAAERHWRSKQVRQWLREGYMVLGDRYYLSGMVYCKAEGISFEEFSYFHQGIAKPNIYLWLKLPLTIALQRRGRQARDKWEEEMLAQKVTNIYPEAFDYVKIHEAAEVSIIDATDSESTLLKKALSLISQKAELHLDVEALFENLARKKCG